jgi:hypothetical protein
MIQVTERDEFAYQEMLAHLPLFSHPNPCQVRNQSGQHKYTLTGSLKLKDFYFLKKEIKMSLKSRHNQMV